MSGIRLAARQEIAKIEAVYGAAYAQYRDVLPPMIFDAYMQDLRSLDQHWAAAEVYVAERNERIGGSVLFYADAAAQGVVRLPPARRAS